MPPQRGRVCRGGAGPHMDVHQQHGEPSSDSEAIESRHSATDMTLSPARSLSHVEVCLVTMESIATQLDRIHLNIDTLREQRYEDMNELVSYINDLEHVHNETFDSVEGLWCQQQHTNDHLHTLESRVEHIDYHMHERDALFVALQAFPSNLHP